MKTNLPTIKSKDKKILTAVKILLNLIDDKFTENVMVLSAAIFNPYLKKSILEKHGNLVENHIIGQLNDKKLDTYYEDYQRITRVDSLIVEDEEDEAKVELTGANKKLKFDEDFSFSQERVGDETAEEEFKRYKNSRLSQSDVAVLFGKTKDLCLRDCWYSNVLGWWKVNECNYPRMAALAKYYLSIPASSAFSERCFSFAGNTRSIKRTAISDSKLEMIAVLKTIDYDLWSIVENDFGQ